MSGAKENIGNYSHAESTETQLGPFHISVMGLFIKNRDQVKEFNHLRKKRSL